MSLSIFMFSSIKSKPSWTTSESILERGIVWLHYTKKLTKKKFDLRPSYPLTVKPFAGENEVLRKPFHFYFTSPY